MLSKDIYQKIFSKISDNDIETFKSLIKVCKNSYKAGVTVSEQKYIEFLNQKVYVYLKISDGWGGYYYNEWKLSLTRPSDIEIDPFSNSIIIFEYKMKELLERLNR